MLLLYCLDPLEPRRPDPDYAAEVAVSEQLRNPRALLDHDALVRDADAARAARRGPPQPRPATAVYRGWMVTPEQYVALY